MAEAGLDRGDRRSSADPRSAPLGFEGERRRRLSLFSRRGDVGIDPLRQEGLGDPIGATLAEDNLPVFECL